MYCTRTSVKKSIHALINEQTQNTVQPLRKVVRERERESEWISRYPCIFCVCYIRSFSVPLFLCSHSHCVFMFCTGTNTNASANTASAVLTFTHMIHAHRERSLLRSFTLCPSCSLVHLFSIPLIRFNVPTKNGYTNQHHRIHRAWYIDRTILQSEPDSCVYASCVLGKFSLFGIA